MDLNKTSSDCSVFLIDPNPNFGSVGKREFEGEGQKASPSLERFREAGLLSKEGKPRLTCARSVFLDLRNMDFEGLIEYFDTWMNFKEYMVLQQQTLKGVDVERKTIAVKCSKRGNDVYQHRVKKRFAFFSTLENKVLFDWKNRSKKLHSVKIIFATLTFNPALCNIQTAWEDRVGKEYNSWITNLRNKFGRVEAIRTFEAYSNGFPHVHVVLVFQDVEFKTFKDKKGVWRIQNKEVFEAGWKSFVDVQAVKDLSGGLFYVSKHILKNEITPGPALEEDLWKYYLTLSLCWIFLKRSYAVSKGFLDLMKSMRISNSMRSVQLDLFGEKVLEEIVWVFLGIYSASRLGIVDNSWSVELSGEVLNGIV